MQSSSLRSVSSPSAALVIDVGGDVAESGATEGGVQVQEEIALVDALVPAPKALQTNASCIHNDNNEG